MFISKVTFVAVLVGLAVGFPSTSKVEDYRNDHAEEKAGFFEGDMILNKDQLKATRSKTRNGLIAESYRWPNNVVYYEIDPMFEEFQRSYILKAFETMESVSCIKFVPRTDSSKHYVYVTGTSSGCFSEVGFQTGVQILNLEPNVQEVSCFRLATIMHEFIHALGFYHQQSASDRDDYVTIIEENIDAAHLHNFNKYSPGVITDFGVEYDYGSVMHYNKFAFSKNGLPTIVPKDPNVEIGQRVRLSESDILKLNRMYKCPQADKKE